MRSCLPIATAIIVTELCDDVHTEAEETFGYQEILEYVFEVSALGPKKELRIEHVIQRSKI